MSALAAPLARRRVLVTRAEERGGPLTSLLRARGATVIHWPGFRIVTRKSRELREAAASLQRYDWLVFTSGNAVQAFAACEAVPPRSLRIAAVGASTAAAVHELGWRVHLQPQRANGDALARALIRRGISGRRLLIPCSERASPELAQALRRAGAQVDAICAYRLAPVRRPRSLTAAPPLDAVTFTSPSTIEGLETQLGTGRLQTLLARAPAIVIGTTTARALAARGVRPARIARPTTLAGLVDAVEKAISRNADRPRARASARPHRR